jgi:hypothetical protein
MAHERIALVIDGSLTPPQRIVAEAAERVLDRLEILAICGQAHAGNLERSRNSFKP